MIGLMPGGTGSAVVPGRWDRGTNGIGISARARREMPPEPALLVRVRYGWTHIQRTIRGAQAKYMLCLAMPNPLSLVFSRHTECFTHSLALALARYRATARSAELWPATTSIESPNCPPSRKSYRDRIQSSSPGWPLHRFF